MTKMIESLVALVGENAAKRVVKVFGGCLRAELRVSSVESLVARCKLTETAARRLRAAADLGHELVGEPLVRGAAMRSSADIFRHFSHLSDLRVEQFHVVLLDGKHRILRTILVSQGTLTSSPVHPRETFAHAVRESAAAVVLVHNHPSGDPAPSSDDLAITRRLTEAGLLLGITVLDHVVIGDGRYVSLADRGLLGA